jgi:hypothetical protein
MLGRGVAERLSWAASEDLVSRGVVDAAHEADVLGTVFRPSGVCSSPGAWGHTEASPITETRPKRVRPARVA